MSSNSNNPRFKTNCNNSIMRESTIPIHPTKTNFFIEQSIIPKAHIPNGINSKIFSELPNKLTRPPSEKALL